MEVDASPLMTYQAPSEEATRPEIAFFDLETTVPMRAGQGYALLEFGAILVCPNRLVELESYSTLIRPSDLSAISPMSVRCNGIDRETAASAPSFVEVADRIFQILHGRVWAGHNILRFDCVRILEAFAEIGRPLPQPRGTIDTLPLLTQKFGRRAGDMKMATLAAYFGLGQQKHRSLDDVRMNLEVLKYCATVLFLESNFTDIFRVNNLVHESTIPRNNPHGNASPEEIRLNVESDVTTAASSTPVSNMEPFNLMNHLEQMRINQNESMKNFRSTICTTLAADEGCSQYAGFLQPDEVSLQCISASLATPFQQSGHRILLLHKDDPLQLCQMGLKILFGLSTKFVDNHSRRKLSFVVNVEPSLQQILDFCDRLAQNSHLESGSSSHWMPVINTSYANSSSIRLRISTVVNDNRAMYPTEIYQKEPSGDTQKLVFSKTDATELDTIIVPGNMVDAYFNLETYDFQQYAGIRLVSQRLVLHAS